MSVLFEFRTADIDLQVFNILHSLQEEKFVSLSFITLIHHTRKNLKKCQPQIEKVLQKKIFYLNLQSLIQKKRPHLLQLRKALSSILKK